MEDKTKTSFTVKREQLQVVMSRTFDAPAALIYKAFTDPNLIPKWWGPAEYKTTIDKMDVRVGGEWRFIQVGADGSEYAFSGVYKEIIPNEKITNTFNYEAIGFDHEVVETVTFEERDGKTYLTTVSVFQNLEDIDGMVASGMESGAVEGMERLAELVENA